MRQYEVLLILAGIEACEMKAAARRAAVLCRGVFKNSLLEGVYD
jgi:hypothetical protein